MAEAAPSASTNLKYSRLSQPAQALLATDLQSPNDKRWPLSAAQQAIESFAYNMIVGKVLLVANLPPEVRQHEKSLNAARNDHP